MCSVDQTVLTRFSIPLQVGDFITNAAGYGQGYLVQEVFEPTAEGYEVKDYLLRLVTEDKCLKPMTELFKVGTVWQLVEASYIPKKAKFRVVSKRKKYYD